MLALLVMVAYVVAGVRSAGWGYRMQEEENSKLVNPAHQLLATQPWLWAMACGVFWPIAYLSRFIAWAGAPPARLLARSVRALFLSGYCRPGDKEKALLEAENEADDALLAAQAEVDLERRLNCGCDRGLSHPCIHQEAELRKMGLL